MTKEIIEIPEDLVMNIDDIKEQIDFKSREEFIVAAVRRLLDVYNQILLDNC